MHFGRGYNVFNAEQCEGVDVSDLAAAETLPDFEPIEAAEAIVSGYKDAPTIDFGGTKAAYRPSTDEVLIPERQSFEDRESYYATLFHELAHSTGHSSRLNRGLDRNLAPFGSPDYSREELVAEMSAAFLAAAAGISPPTIEQSAAYLDNWCRRLKGDKRLVILAASSAQKAADWILGTNLHEPTSTQTGEEAKIEGPGSFETTKETRLPSTQLHLF